MNVAVGRYYLGNHQEIILFFQMPQQSHIQSWAIISIVLQATDELILTFNSTLLFSQVLMKLIQNLLLYVQLQVKK